MSETVQERGIDIDAKGVMKMIPHRYPFLMIDRVENAVADKGCVGIKNVTMNEPFFQGHFPGRPVMPGVLVVEALAQAGGLLTQLSKEGDAAGKVFYLVKVDNAKFSRMVVPGDQLELCVSLKRSIRNMAQFDAVARVDGQQVACAEILCAEAQE